MHEVNSNQAYIHEARWRRIRHDTKAGRFADLPENQKGTAHIGEAAHWHTFVKAWRRSCKRVIN